MSLLPHRSKVVLRHLIERNVEERPQKECILFEDGEQWTYEALLKAGYQAANTLSEIGIKRGENVLIFLPNGPEWIRALLGVTFLGAVIVPINTAYRGRMLRHICEDSRARHIIMSQDSARVLEGLDLDLNIIEPQILETGAGKKPALETAIEPWDTMAIVYTSGTTGPSKGVMTSYFHMYTHGIMVWSRATAEDTQLVDMPLFHAMALFLATALWSVGGKIALRTVFSGTLYWDVIRKTGATIASTVGTMAAFLKSMTPKPDDADHSLRAMTFAPMVDDPVSFGARFGIKELWVGFSMTELSCPLMNHGPIIKPKSCGRPRKGVEVRIVDAHDIPVAPGEVGELIVRTDLPWEINGGYYGRPEETARAWQNGWFHTGDLFTCDPDGDYFFVDREKDAIRRRGENISSFEVEREVLSYPNVAEAACVAAEGPLGEDEVKVFVIPDEGSGDEGSRFDPVDLIQYLIPRMPYFMVPRFIEEVDDFPRTPTLRIKKYELRARGNSDVTWDREAAGIRVTRNS